MSDLHFLVEDPRPELTDNHLWNALLPSIFLSGFPTRRAYDIACALWTARDLGTMIKRTHQATTLEPLIKPIGCWDSEEQFREIKSACLKPYWKEIKYLLDKLP
ncbi:hypothetical protein OB236_38460 [Paenibacillus sp. WQ 127069]|uniref:Uncharacterized protein n=1 Tax=Paenibacillus baimaensis TaxID=2982185 RepID=A0ABT2UTP6_9BACL|nr:hypothetical protein [Paenibacillus sp. WQ 127069]MCU6798025.1 hypothetical protein [Paenibacillus sp. WQ 127069]